VDRASDLAPEITQRFGEEFWRDFGERFLSNNYNELNFKQILPIQTINIRRTL
jgi:hypothetical protein